MDKKEFDYLADRYEQNILPWMKITGESIEFYAQSRITWVANQIRKRGCNPLRIMDFGCGVGLATTFFLKEFGSDTQIIGVDVSRDSLKIARSKYTFGNVKFQSLDEYIPDQSEDLIYCNGVFHHIPIRERDKALQYVYDSLRPGGFFALWENNPWNPMTRYNMTHAEIDKNAIPLNPLESRRIVLSKGFRLLKTRFYFVFPAILKFFRPLEGLISPFPIGAQYVVFSQKDKE